MCNQIYWRMHITREYTNHCLWHIRTTFIYDSHFLWCMYITFVHGSQCLWLLRCLVITTFIPSSIFACVICSGNYLYACTTTIQRELKPLNINWHWIWLKKTMVWFSTTVIGRGLKPFDTKIDLWTGLIDSIGRIVMIKKTLF